MRDGLTNCLRNQLHIVLHRCPIVVFVSREATHQNTGGHRVVDIEGQYDQIAHGQVVDGLFDLKLRHYDGGQVEWNAFKQAFHQILCSHNVCVSLVGSASEIKKLVSNKIEVKLNLRAAHLPIGWRWERLSRRVLPARLSAS